MSIFANWKWRRLKVTMPAIVVFFLLVGVAPRGHTTTWGDVLKDYDMYISQQYPTDVYWMSNASGCIFEVQLWRLRATNPDDVYWSYYSYVVDGSNVIGACDITGPPTVIGPVTVGYVLSYQTCAGVTQSVDTGTYTANNYGSCGWSLNANSTCWDALGDFIFFSDCGLLNTNNSTCGQQEDLVGTYTITQANCVYNNLIANVFGSDIEYALNRPINQNCQDCVPIGAQFDGADPGYVMVDPNNEVEDPNQQVCFYYNVSGDSQNPNPSYIPLSQAGYGADLSSSGSGTIIAIPQGSCSGQSIQITNITNITPPNCSGLAAPYTCANPSFIALYNHETNGTPTGDDIALTGRALQGGTDISDQISWTCISNPDNLGTYTNGGTCYLGNPAIATGATITFIPNPPAAPTGRTAPLSYQITAQINVTGVPAQDTKVITQDKLDELRQEYEDFPAVESQERTKFDRDEPAYSGLIGSAAEPNRFNGWHILRSLNGHARATVNNYSTLNITSGYRTPIGNNNLRPRSAANSNHQYGRAFDFVQQRSAENYDAFRAAFNAGARDDTYLQGSNGIRYYWYRTPPRPNRLPRGVTYIQGHAAWVN